MSRLHFVVLLAAAPCGRPSSGGRCSRAEPGFCAAGGESDTTSADRPQYPSTYRRLANPPVLIRNATVLTAAGESPAMPGSLPRRQAGRGGAGAAVQVPADAVVVDGTASS
jgi:hypothetical protein